GGSCDGPHVPSRDTEGPGDAWADLKRLRRGCDTNIRKRGKAMKALELRDGFYWAGIVDDNLRVFDIIMYTEFGTTYNSYVWKAGDKIVLFETAKEKFFDEYLDKLKEIIDVTKIDYLIVDHTEPDHAGSIGKLLE